MEADLNRVKLTIDRINVEQQHSFQRSNKIQERMKYLNIERTDLEDKLAVFFGQELSVKPQTYSEKVLDAEAKKAQEDIKSLGKTKLARVSVHGIKIKQILTREKQASKQIKATTKELSNTESKIAE